MIKQNEDLSELIGLGAEELRKRIPNITEENLYALMNESIQPHPAKRVIAELELRHRENNRDHEEWRHRFEMESNERVKAQEFQAAQMDRQLEVANQQAISARNASRAAWASAIAAIGVVILSLVQLFLLK